MSKHILDRVRGPAGPAKAAHYAQINQAERPSPQAIALQKRARASDQPERAKRYTDIDRGKTV